MEFLSQDWIAARFRLATSARWLPNMDLRLQHVVRDGPSGTVRYFDDVRGGILIESDLGEIDAPDVTITNSWADELAVMLGELDMFDVLLGGRVEVDGDHGRLFTLVPTLTSPPVVALARSLLLNQSPALITVDPL